MLFEKLIFIYLLVVVDFLQKMYYNNKLSFGFDYIRNMITKS